ncbi:MAG: polysaccharide deacetylase family protein [Saprospiraceae bacterium]|jgi:peptidoglycan/xylan/chitin deacetylase (PgdA/CDA1 family)|nr:polysaccharide deacetylase family protein [Saprospiraceae bacterium]
MYLVKTPPVVKTLFSDFIWSMPSDEKKVYLTFDDGPVPVVTPWVLDVLKDYDFEATFFCVGENVKNYSKIYARILRDGHATGNHTFNHLNGWFTDKDTYLENIKMCDEYVHTQLFRPPYGKLKPGQAAGLKTQKTIVMWDVLSGDFDKFLSPEKCLDNVQKNYESGSVIVFHDSLKAEEKLKFILPAFLTHLSDNGYKAAAIPAEIGQLVEV